MISFVLIVTLLERLVGNMYNIKCPWCGQIARRDPTMEYTYCDTMECKAACVLAGVPGISDELLANSRIKLAPLG